MSNQSSNSAAAFLLHIPLNNNNANNSNNSNNKPQKKHAPLEGKSRKRVHEQTSTAVASQWSEQSPLKVDSNHETRNGRNMLKTASDSWTLSGVSTTPPLQQRKHHSAPQRVGSLSERSMSKQRSTDSFIVGGPRSAPHSHAFHETSSDDEEEQPEVEEEEDAEEQPHHDDNVSESVADDFDNEQESEMIFSSDWNDSKANEHDSKLSKSSASNDSLKRRHLESSIEIAKKSRHTTDIVDHHPTSIAVDESTHLEPKHATELNLSTSSSLVSSSSTKKNRSRTHVSFATDDSQSKTSRTTTTPEPDADSNASSETSPSLRQRDEHNPSLTQRDEHNALTRRYGHHRLCFLASY
jgi:hypothetical protein